MPREILKPDPARLVSLQRRLAAMRAQSRGVWDQKQVAERERDLLDAQRLALAKREGSWDRVRAPPIAVRHPLEARAWNDALNDPGTALIDLKRQIAELDQEVAALEHSYRALMEHVRPLSALVSACERHLGRAGVVLRGTVQGVAPKNAQEFIPLPEGAAR